MEQLGEYLRNEREKQGRALDDIARATRIARVTLQAIESGPEEKLPPVSYLRGFVKLYARELGLDVDDMLERLPGHAAENIRVALPRSIDLETPKVPWFKIGLIVLLLCVACLWAGQLFFGFELFVQDAPPAIVSPRPALPGEAPGPSALMHTPQESQTDTGETAAHPQFAESVPAAVTAERTVEPFIVRFAARGTVWIQIRDDENKTVDITLRNGEHYRMETDRTVEVRLGNPALVDVWYNDIPVSLGGTPGRPLDVVFPDSVL